MKQHSEPKCLARIETHLTLEQQSTHLYLLFTSSGQIQFPSFLFHLLLSLKQFHFFLYFFVSHYSRNKRREVRKECELFKRQNANESFDRSVSVCVNDHRAIYVLIWERYQAITQVPFMLMSLWFHVRLMW